MIENTSVDRGESLVLTALVTRDSLAEYELLRYSFELFHGSSHHWRLYCDSESLLKLSQVPNTDCRLLESLAIEFKPQDHPKTSYLKKLAAIEDVWATNRFSTVIYLDTDIVFTAPVLDYLSSLDGDVLLTPHYFCSPRQQKDLELWGAYNNGFVVMRNRAFHAWWKEALVSNPDKFADQQCLDEAPLRFNVGHLSELANYGPWRGPSGTQSIPHALIPQGCMFVKVHMLMPADSAVTIAQKAFVSDLTRLSNMAGGTSRPVEAAFRDEDMIQKIFAIQCLQYLQESRLTEHQTLFSEILTRDHLGIYRSLLTKTAAEQAKPRARDYVSPGLNSISLDEHFPDIRASDKTTCQRDHFRSNSIHLNYSDRRNPSVPLVNRDEAHILYNSALAASGKRALEIGSWIGWSTCHLAVGGVLLDAVDPQLSDETVQNSIIKCLTSAAVKDRVALWAGRSPELIHELSVGANRRWSLIFIDGNPEHPNPLRDAAMAHEVAERDAVILMHNAVSPDAGKGLEYLKSLGWEVGLYYTAQIMGVAWRGEARPLDHAPDPAVPVEVPAHLNSFAIIGAARKSSPLTEYDGALASA